MFGSKLVKVALGGLVLGAVVTACGPVQVGAAATVGSQRISEASLDKAVTDWNSAIQRNPLNLQNVQLSDQSSIPRSVLSWLINFKIVDQAAKDRGITVVPGQLDAYRASYEQQSSQQGKPSLSVQALASGIPPAYDDQLVRFLYLRDAVAKVVTGGLNQQQGQVAFLQAMTGTAHALHIKVSPRYGSFNDQQLALGPVKTYLSMPDSGTSSS